MNNVTLVGRLTRDPELRYIQSSGTAVASFSVAIDRTYTKKDGSKETDFIPIEVMGKIGEAAANNLSKGDLVGISGSIRVEQYKDQQGNNKTFTKVSANRVEYLLTSHSRQNQGQQNGGYQQNNGYQQNGGYQQQNNNGGWQQNNNNGGWQPQGNNPMEFQAIDDDDIPF